MSGSYLSGIFGSSPVKPLQEHMEKVVLCVSELVPFTHAVLDNDQQSRNTIHGAIIDLEHEADALKKELRLRLPSSLFMPIDRRDVLEMLTMQDQVAGGARDVAYSSAEDMLQSNPEVNILYGCNDNSSLGALAAFQAAGRGLAENGIPLTELFIGTGGTEGEMLAIADPNSPMKLTMAMNPRQNSVDIMNLILDTISGKVDRLAYSQIPIPGTNVDAWSWSVEELEAYAHDVYFSELDFKAELGLE